MGIKNSVSHRPMGIKCIPIWHPHFALSKITNKISDNGIYNNLLSLGFNSVFDLYKIVITDELLALISIGLAFQHFIWPEGMIDSIAFYYINWPIARGIKSVLDSCFDGNWVYDIAPMDKDDFGGLKSNTISLYL